MPPLPPPTVRPERPDDAAELAAVGDVVCAAFGDGRADDHGEEVRRLVAAIRAGAHAEPDLSLVALAQ